MNRRGFLTACIATLTAPAIVRADSLMRVRARVDDFLDLDLSDASLKAIKQHYFEFGTTVSRVMVTEADLIAGRIPGARYYSENRTWTIDREIEYEGKPAYLSQTLRFNA